MRLFSAVLACLIFVVAALGQNRQSDRPWIADVTPYSEAEEVRYFREQLAAVVDEAI